MLKKLNLKSVQRLRVVAADFRAEGLVQAGVIPETWAPDQTVRVGWDQVDGTAIFATDGCQVVAYFRVDVRKPDPDDVAAAVEAEVAKIMEVTGKRPGKRELREITQSAFQALLPEARVKTKTYPVVFDADSDFEVVYVFSSSAKIAGMVYEAVHAAEKIDDIFLDSAWGLIEPMARTYAFRLPVDIGPRLQRPASGVSEREPRLEQEGALDHLMTGWLHQYAQDFQGTIDGLALGDEVTLVDEATEIRLRGDIKAEEVAGALALGLVASSAQIVFPAEVTATVAFHDGVRYLSKITDPNLGKAEDEVTQVLTTVTLVERLYERLDAAFTSYFARRVRP